MTRRPGPTTRVLLAADAGLELADLEPLVLRIFGAGDRPPGWFRRKLAREGVDPACSSLAFGPGDELVGYLLVGAEPDPPGPPTAHCAGLGVLPDHRGHGLGPALIACSIAAARRRAAALHALAEPPLRGFYERLGFHPLVANHTLQTFGLGRRDLDLAKHPPAAWPLPGRTIASWRPGTWSRTPTAQAATVQLERGAVHLSREGRAILVQRLCVDADDDETSSAAILTLEALRQRFAAATPILLYGCDTVSCVTAAILRTPHWRVVQTAWEMQLRFIAAVDKHAPPAASCRPN